MRDAGAIGIVLVDNRAGEPNGIPVELGCPRRDDLRPRRSEPAGVHARRHGRPRDRSGSSDVSDPPRSRPAAAAWSRASRPPGPTTFGHQLKPDVAAPGGQILSSTLPEFAGAPFAVFDGTSMAAPHVSGAAALLLQLHPGWTPQQIKSALMTTAGPAWGDTARTQEAPVMLEGAGLINVDAADNPLLFTDPSSLSFGDLNARTTRARKPLVVVSDAGGGGGTWTSRSSRRPPPPGAIVPAPRRSTLAPGGTASVRSWRRGQRRADRRRLRLRRPAHGQPNAARPVLLPRHAARNRGRRAKTIRRRPGRHTKHRARLVEHLPLSRAALRPAVRSTPASR